MFQRLVHDWNVDRARQPEDDAPAYTPAQVAEKVKIFFHKYQIGRHKSTSSPAPFSESTASCKEVAFSFLCVIVTNSHNLSDDLDSLPPLQRL
jgi:hypothetical protein